MPEHKHYVVPYAGGLATIWKKDPVCSEVINDIDLSLTNFWNTLRCPDSFNELVRLCEATPLSEVVWREAKDAVSRFEQVVRQPNDPPCVEAAWAFLVEVRQSRQGLRESFATLSRSRTRRDMNEQASSWLSAVEGLPEAHQRLKRVVVVRGDALRLIRSQDGVKTLFYLDPPYLPATRTAPKAYRHEMTEDEHADMLVTLSQISGKFLLSGYNNELYDLFSREYGWFRTDTEIVNHSSGSSTKKKKTESLWMNFNPLQQDQ